MQCVAIARHRRQRFDAAKHDPDVALGNQEVGFSDDGAYRGIQVDTGDVRLERGLCHASVDEPAHATDLGLDNGHPTAGGCAESIDAKQMRVYEHLLEWSK